MKPSAQGKKERFSRGLALRDCKAEASKKKFGLRIFARSRFIRECIERKRAAHFAKNGSD
jgi:hypothetical protein